MLSLSDAEFGSYLVYSTKGVTILSKNSKAICIAIKNDGTIPVSGKYPRAIHYVTRRLGESIKSGCLNTLFAGAPILIPAPRSSPVVAGALFPTKLICDSMVEQGIGSETRLLLERTKAVPKAATSKPGERPSLEDHYASIRAISDFSVNRPLVVVDDVITSGTMLLISISRLREVFPQLSIRAFALVRTMWGTEIEKILDPCVGTISARGKWAQRIP